MPKRLPFLAFVLLLALSMSCKQVPKNATANNVTVTTAIDDTQSTDNNTAALLAADVAFSHVSETEGDSAAFVRYAADSVVYLKENLPPIIGKAALVNDFAERGKRNLQSHIGAKRVLTWQPHRADISTDGTMGYTFGNWTYTSTTPDGNAHRFSGSYVTVWKRQPDGAWRVVADSGNSYAK